MGHNAIMMPSFRCYAVICFQGFAHRHVPHMIVAPAFALPRVSCSSEVVVNDWSPDNNLPQMKPFSLIILAAIRISRASWNFIEYILLRASP